jgi:hypothetical protein
MNSRILAGAAVLGLAGTAFTSSLNHGTAGAADTAAQSTLTFRLAAYQSEDKYIDIGREGDTPGDRYIAAVTLKADGQVAGRLQTECTVLDNAYEGHLCTMAIVLGDGILTLTTGGISKRLPGVGGRHGDVYAVTGGTGAYTGAEGELSVADDGRIVITLVD